MLDSLLLGKTRAAILRELYLNADRRFSFSELVRRIHSGDGAVSRELKLLLGTGLVVEEREGSQRFLSAATSSPVYPELRAFIAKSSGAAQIIGAALRDLESRIVVAFLFGSTVRGTERFDSDLDLFVIGTAGYSVVTERMYALEERLGRPVQVLYFDPESEQDRVSLAGSSMNAILEGPKQFVIGDETMLAALRARKPGSLPAS